MGIQKPSIPRGTRDFSPIEMVRRNFIFDTIRKVFQKYGYAPIETPAMEKTETLLGKYGEEGDKLIFKILPRGEKLVDFLKIFEHLKNVSNQHGSDLNASNVNPAVVDKLAEDNSNDALRYDLTVPFARYVVQHQNEITFPFKRYQIQPVWRADKPQKGRYREFFQCDADVIGSNSLLNEVELVQIMDDVYSLLNIPVTIKINNRKILSGIAEVIGEKEKIVDITVAIDKLDKIGVDGVNKELKEKNISQTAIDKLQALIRFNGKKEEKISLLKQLISASETGKKGIEELEYVFKKSEICNLKSAILELDITLARGLNYYTGAIFEVKANAGTLTSSITGGGRYDDLTGIFGLPNVSGVGISFGIDRIFDVMNELNLFDKIDYTSQTTKLLFAHLGEAEQNYCIQLASKTRVAGINTEIYPDVTKKIAKQFDYASKKQIPFMIVIGSNEMAEGKFQLKDSAKTEYPKMTIEEIIKKLTAD